MTVNGPIEERALVLAPSGRIDINTEQALELAGVNAITFLNLERLCEELQSGAGMLVIMSTEVREVDLRPLIKVLHHQPAWSDLPILMITPLQQQRSPELGLTIQQLGNLVFIEAHSPLTTVCSLISSALRSRRRQYEYRDCCGALAETRKLVKNISQSIDLKEKLLLSEQKNEEDLRHAQKMEAVGQLTAGIAHDFNNMLTGIIGSLELVRRRLARGKTDDLNNLIDMGITSANRAAGLTHRLLAFSRRQSLDSKPVVMHEWLLSAHNLVQQHTSENTEAQLSIDEQLWTAEVDPLQLENALVHLLSNAQDAMSDGGQLHIRLFNQSLDAAFCANNLNLSPGDYVVLSVADNGHGMAQNTLKRAFDPFFTTKPIGQGTGLGLSMIYGFCKQSRGHIRIHSQEYEGTTVELYLPRFLGGAAQATSACPSRATTLANADKTLLIVEDDDAIRDLVTDVLREQGYVVINATDANSALPIIESTQTIDLLISDVGLPGMNGRQLAEISRQYRPELNVLFITGYAQHATARSGFLESGMQLITKPFTFDVLTAKVDEMIAASRPQERP